MTTSLMLKILLAEMASPCLYILLLTLSEKLDMNDSESLAVTAAGFIMLR